MIVHYFISSCSVHDCVKYLNFNTNGFVHEKEKKLFYTYPTLSDIVFLMHVLTFDLFHITLNLCIFPFYSDVIACFGFLVLFSLILLYLVNSPVV